MVDQWLVIRRAALVAVLALLVLAVGLLIAGPESNLYPIGPLQCLSRQTPGGKAWVRNPELSEEFEILQASGLFELVSERQASKVIELHPLEMGAGCGTPLVLTWATNGLVPATVRVSSTFSFTVEEHGVVSEQQFVLEGERRISLVQCLVKPFHGDTQTWGAILGSEYECGRQKRACRNESLSDHRRLKPVRAVLEISVPTGSGGRAGFK